MTDVNTGAVIVGGPTDGQVSGYGGELTFSLPDDVVYDTVDITVHVVVTTWGNEIFWNIDGYEFGPYDNNSDNWVTVTVPEGEREILYMDDYGDGWHGGYFEIFAGTDGSGTQLVSPVYVAGSGGETDFVLSSGSSGSGDGGSSGGRPVSRR